MSEGNGNGTNGRQETGENGRDGLGRFVEGNPGGPGRPQGTLDFMSIMRRMAAEEEVDLERLVWKAAIGLLEAAAKGDAAAGKLMFDRVNGLLDKGMSVNVDARQVTVGPPMPEGRRLADWLLDVGKASAEVMGDEDG